MDEKKKHSVELEQLLNTFPSWIKYAQIGICIFVAVIFAVLLYFV